MKRTQFVLFTTYSRYDQVNANEKDKTCSIHRIEEEREKCRRRWRDNIKTDFREM
jgi:hypothetical protein